MNDRSVDRESGSTHQRSFDYTTSVGQRDEQARAMQTAILDTAQAAFADRGFHATSLRDVATAIGVSQPLIHHHFGSKAALFQAVVARAAERYETAQAAQWDREPDDVRFFVDGLRVFFDVVGEHRDMARLAFWARTEERLPELPGSELDARIHQKYVDAKAAGVLRADLDILVARILIGGVVRGFWDLADNMPELRARAPELTASLLDAILVSILSPDALAEARRILATTA